jgi:RimJ/RimL family protein N-acetyltransferase
MTYHCLKNNKYIKESLCFVSLRFEDMALIKNWRNDQMRILRQNKPLTDEDQRNYYFEVVCKNMEAKHPSMILFSLLDKELCVGYGGLTNINWGDGSAEISFLVDTAFSYEGQIFCEYFENFLDFIKDLAFSELNLDWIFTETYDIRPKLVASLEKKGFLFQKRLLRHVVKNDIYYDSLIHVCKRKNECMRSLK